MPDDVNAVNECGGCSLAEAVERRDFLRRATAAVMAMFPASLAIEQWQLPAAFVSGRGRRTGKEYPLPAADGVMIDKEESVIIARFDARAYAFSLACPHQNTALRWDDGKRRFQCPKHKSRYRTDGTFIEGRATRGMDRFALRREGDRLLVNLDALYREDTDAAAWAAAFVQLDA